MVKDFSFQFSPFYVKDLVLLCKRFSIIFQTTLYIYIYIYIYNSRFSCARRNVASRSNDDLFQSASSPRRVAVPVLVKDGKPCGSGGGGGNEGSRGGPSAALASPAPHMTAASSPHGTHHAATSSVSHHSVVAGVSHVMSSSQSLQHCSYTRSSAQQGMQQQQQPQCGAYLPLQGRAW